MRAGGGRKGEGKERRGGFCVGGEWGISPGVSRGNPEVTSNKKPGKQHPWFYQTNSHSGLNSKARGQRGCELHLVKMIPAGI